MLRREYYRALYGNLYIFKYCNEHFASGIFYTFAYLLFCTFPYIFVYYYLFLYFIIDPLEIF